MLATVGLCQTCSPRGLLCQNIGHEVVSCRRKTSRPSTREALEKLGAPWFRLVEIVLDPGVVGCNYRHASSPSRNKNGAGSVGLRKESTMSTIPTEPIPKPPPELPPGLPPDLPQPPIEEPEPDVLPDEIPNPNPDENDKPPKHLK